MNWTKAGVLAEALGSLGIVFTLFYSVWSFTTTLRDSYYAEAIQGHTCSASFASTGRSCRQRMADW
jgi:hypothetical protein